MNGILLSICIPTYNRAAKVASIVNSFINEYNNLSIEDKELCELIVRDNGSTDNTEFVIKDILSKYKFASYYRNPENIGAECNFAKISYDARGSYIWWVGDDDAIKPGLVKTLLSDLKQYSPAMVFINHRGIEGNSGKIDFPSAIRSDNKLFYEDGRKAIVDIISYSKVGPMLFMTAKVCKKEYLLQSLQKVEIPFGALPLHTAFYVASKGPVWVMKDTWIDNIYGEISWGDIASWIFCQQIPEAISRLNEWGYSLEQKEVIEKSYFTINQKERIRAYWFAKNHPTLYKYLHDWFDFRIFISGKLYRLLK